VLEQQQKGSAFETFRALTGTPNVDECNVLIRNMAQLFTHVSERCDDEQVAQYDEVLCQLADLVEAEARAHVAQLLAPLDRAPGTVVVKLANDAIEVARPLLEFSNVLSDDDLIEIVQNLSEDHRVAIAGREQLTDRVGGAIATHGEEPSMRRLVTNANAQLGEHTLPKLIERVGQIPALAEELRARTDIDWGAVRDQIDEAGHKVLAELGLEGKGEEGAAVNRVNAVVYNRMKNRAGFDAQEWKIAWNQVRALNDRKRLDARAIERFARFGYGHHTAAGLTLMLNVMPEIVVKWLANQDYVALTVAARALGMRPELFENLVAVMPWRDLPSTDERANIRRRFEALSPAEARGIFDLWRAHSFRRRGSETGRPPAAAESAA
jgi:hypothetical protein